MLAVFILAALLPSRPHFLPLGHTGRVGNPAVFSNSNGAKLHAEKNINEAPRAVKIIPAGGVTGANGIILKFLETGPAAASLSSVEAVVSHVCSVESTAQSYHETIYIMFKKSVGKPSDCVTSKRAYTTLAASLAKTPGVHVVMAIPPTQHTSIPPSAELNNFPGVPPNLPGNTIDGSGARVVVLDTGLYVGHCRYAKNPPNFATVDYGDTTFSEDNDVYCPLALVRSEPRSLENKPVAEYIRGACVTNENFNCNPYYETDNIAGYMDHGTHVTSLALMAAPGATMVTMDLQNLEFHGNSAIVYPPLLSRYNFDVLQRCAAGGDAPYHHTVFSLSWGGDAQGVYTDTDAQLDYFTYANPYATIVAAAGNSGGTAGATVLSPCSGKNVLCVGAANSLASFYQKCHRTSPDFDACWKPIGAARPHFRKPTGLFANIYPDKCYATLFSSSGVTEDGRQGPQVHAPSMLLGDYSQFGYSPGDENNIGSCDPRDTLAAMQGSSMATPVVAGYVAFVADAIGGPNRVCYVHGASEESRDCVFRTAPAGSAAFREPGPVPSSLIRAVMLVTTTPHLGIVGVSSHYSSLDGAYELYHYLHSQNTPVPEHGYGCTNPRDAISSPTIPMYLHTESAQRSFYETETILSNVKKHLYCFDAVDIGVARVALVWNDYPGFLGETTALVHDLALSAVYESLHGVSLFGGVNADVLNNHEVIDVSIQSGAYGQLRIAVQANHLNAIALEMQPLMYSLVVHGPVESVECPENCPKGTLVQCDDGIGIGQSLCAEDWSAQHPCIAYTQCYQSADGVRKWPFKSSGGPHFDTCRTIPCDPLKKHRCVYGSQESCSGVYGCCCSESEYLLCKYSENLRMYFYSAPLLAPAYTGSLIENICIAHSFPPVRRSGGSRPPPYSIAAVMCALVYGLGKVR